MDIMYQILRDNNAKKSTGRGTISWEYYDIMSQIFENDRTINYGPTLSSMSVSVNKSIKQTKAHPLADSSLQSLNTIPLPISCSGPSTSSANVISCRNSHSENGLNKRKRTPSPDDINPSSTDITPVLNLLLPEPRTSNSRKEENVDTKRKHKQNKENYELRRKMLEIEKERVEAINRLVVTVEESNSIQRERNVILAQLISNNK